LHICFNLFALLSFVSTIHTLPTFTGDEVGQQTRTGCLFQLASLPPLREFDEIFPPISQDDFFSLDEIKTSQ
jgi:hypothetical protein